MSTISNLDFSKFLWEDKLCDVVIRVNDAEFKAHKIILCGCSSYFRRLFRSEPSPVYSFPHVSPNIISLILEYAYTSSVVVTEENVQELLAVADYFDVKGVLKASFDFLEQKLCVKNCISTQMSANLHNCPDLRQKAYLYILHHFEEVAESSVEFLQLAVQQLVDFIKQDELNVTQESAVFEAILRWINHAPEERRSHIDVLLSKVRLLVIPIEYLIDTVSKNNLVQNSLVCLTMVKNATKTLQKSNMDRPLNYTRLPYAVLLAFGGWVTDFPSESIEVYNVRADCWVRLPNNGESYRMFHGCVYLNGFVYCIGGLNNTDYLRSVRKLNLVTHTWQEAGPMHSVRCYVSVAVLNGCIYAMGGYDKYVYLNTAERYKPDTNQWSLIAPMHDQRTDASAATLHGKIYICGGNNGEECLSSAECYNPHSNQWTLITPMETGLQGGAVIAYKDLLYVAGGFNGISCVNSVAAYDPQSHRWRTIAPMRNARSNFGTAVLEDQLYVVGGFENDVGTGNVECYDGKTNRWKSVQPIKVPYNTLSCCVVERGPDFPTYLLYQ